jgi:4-alpha-glucanotransferase
LNTRAIVRWEEGENRRLPEMAVSTMLTQVFRQTFQWKGAGVAIPVFSLRSENDWGVGEFYDLKEMVDWAEQTGQKLIQILPINDKI